MSWPELFGFSIGGRAPVIVTSIDENSVAQKSGLQVGDQLIEIEHENVQQFGVDDVILCAKRALNYPPFLSVLSRIRTVEIKYHQNCGYGLQFKGQGPVYIHAVFKFSPAYELGIRAGDMLLEVNGVQVTYSTQQDVETLVATIQSVLQIVLIPRAVKLNKNEIVRKENQINKATFFYKIINYYLGGDIEKKVTLIQNLNSYTKDKNISKLAYSLNNLLEDDVQRRLVEYIRPYIPAGHWNKLDIVMKRENHQQRHHTWSKSTTASEISNLHKRAHTSLSISTGNRLLRNVRNNNKSRVVQIQRNIDSGSLGVILQNNKPVIIHSVNTGGPAEVAGLKKGDLILEINGQDVRNHCYPHVIELLKNSGSFPRLLVRSGGNINFKSVNNINESRLSLRKPKTSTKKEKTLKEYGNDFKEQMLIRLTHGEQLVIHEALLAYLYNRNLSELFETLSSILDKPYKIQLLHYLSYLLPQETLPSFEQYAIELMDKTIEAHKREYLKQQKQERQKPKQQKQNKQHKQKHSNNNNDSLESLLYEEDESFDILFETLKILGSPQEVRKQDVSGSNNKDQFIANDSLVSENDLKHIEKGSTLDLLLSMDRSKLQKLKKEVIANTVSNHTIANKTTTNKMKGNDETSIVKEVNNGIASDSNYGNGYCDDLIYASRERFSRNSHQNGIIEEDDISQTIEPCEEIFTVPYTTAHDEYIDRGPPNFVPTPPPSRRHTSVEPRNISSTTPKSKRRNTFDNVKLPIESKEHVKKGKMKKPARHLPLKEKSINKINEIKSINKVTEIKNLFDNQDLNNNNNDNNINGQDNPHVNKQNIQNGVNVIDCSNQNYIKNNEIKSNKSKPPPPIRKESLNFLNKNENIFDRNENENEIKNEIFNVQDRNKEKEAINFNKELAILHSSRPFISSNHKPLSDKNLIGEKTKQQFKPMDNEISNDNMLTSAISSTPIVPLLNFDNIIPTSESTIMFPTPPPLNDLHPLLHPALSISAPPPPPPPLPNMVSPPPPPLLPIGGGELKVEMQLKRINWEKLSGARLENTVWGEMKPTEEMINFDELEELFTTKPSNNIVKKADTTKQSEGLLCSKKVHNLGILLGHLKLSIDEIFKAVMNVDYTTLTDAHIQTMLTCAPDPNETAVFNEIFISSENENEMSMADRFTIKMMTIPHYYERLKIMLYRSEFSEKMKELKPDITSVLNACRELRESQKLRHILEVVLTAGNYMNKGYNRVAGASGFKISFLPKLMSTKTSDNNSTLLHVIVNNFLKNKPEVLTLIEELESIPNAAKVSSQMISQEITLLKQGMKELEDELFLSRDNVLPNDKFAKVMSQFVSEAHHSFHELLTQYSLMQADFKQLVEFFGDEYTKTTTEDFFGSFAIFLQHIETTKEALLTSQNEFNQKQRPNRRSFSQSRNKYYDRRKSLPNIINKSNLEFSHKKYSTIIGIDPEINTLNENRRTESTVNGTELSENTVNGNKSTGNTVNGIEFTENTVNGTEPFENKVNDTKSIENTVDETKIVKTALNPNKKEVAESEIIVDDEILELQESPNNFLVGEKLMLKFKRTSPSPRGSFSDHSKDTESVTEQTCELENTNITTSPQPKLESKDLITKAQHIDTDSVFTEQSNETEALKINCEPKDDKKASSSQSGDLLKHKSSGKSDADTDITEYQSRPEMDRQKKLSLTQIAAKVSSVPISGSLSGNLRSNPPSLVNAWEMSVDINTDVSNNDDSDVITLYNQDKDVNRAKLKDNLKESVPNTVKVVTMEQSSVRGLASVSPKPYLSPNSSPGENRKIIRSSSEIINDVINIADQEKTISPSFLSNSPSLEVNVVTANQPAKQKPPVSPKPSKKMFATANNENKSRSEIAKEKCGHIKSHVHDLETALDQKNISPDLIHVSVTKTVIENKESEIDSSKLKNTVELNNSVENQNSSGSSSEVDNLDFKETSNIENENENEISKTTKVSIDLSGNRSFSITSISPSVITELEQDKNGKILANSEVVDEQTIESMVDLVTESEPNYPSNNQSITDGKDIKLSNELNIPDSKEIDQSSESSTTGNNSIDPSNKQNESENEFKDLAKEPGTLKRVYNDVIRSSRSLNGSPKYLDQVKHKLEEEKIRSERPKLRRKITKHEQPLYALVMKETIQEYEQQRRELDDENINKTRQVIDHTETRNKNESPNFLNIMHQKLKEKAPSVTDELGDMDSTRTKKISVTEPAYASVIRETLQNYEVEKKEHDRSRKTAIINDSSGLTIHENNTGRNTPNFLSMLEENLLELNLIAAEEHENSDLNTALCEDEPLFAIVIKAALEEFRKKKKYKITSVTPNNNDVESQDRYSSQQSITLANRKGSQEVSLEGQISPSSTSSSSSSDHNKSQYEGDHSPSSSDLSLTSEEVKQINQKVFSSMDRKLHSKLPDQDQGTFLETGSKPLLPTIPSPDYKKSEMSLNLRKKSEDHPHHIDRPFWNDSANDKPIESSDSSAPTSPTTPEEKSRDGSSFKRVYDRKRPRRSSLKKKQSNSRLNNVSFMKQVEVIDEVVEIDDDQIVLKDLRSESPLKGSPQAELKRKMTPYHGPYNPIADEIFEEADKQISEKRLSREENRNTLERQNNFTNEVNDIISLESSPAENVPSLEHINTSLNDDVVTAKDISDDSAISDIEQQKSIPKTSTDNANEILKNVTLKRDRSGRISIVGNGKVLNSGINLDLASLAPAHLQQSFGDSIINIALDLVTTTDENGHTTMQLISKGRPPIDIKLPDVNLKTGPTTRRDLPPPPIDRAIKPKSPVRPAADSKMIEDQYAVVEKDKTRFEVSPAILPRDQGSFEVKPAIIPNGKGTASPDILNIDVRHGQESSLLRTIIPSPDYSPDNSPRNSPQIKNKQSSSLLETKFRNVIQVHEENPYEAVEESTKNHIYPNRNSNIPLRTPSPLPSEKSLIKIIAVEEIVDERRSPRDIKTPPQSNFRQSSPVFPTSNEQQQGSVTNQMNETSNVFNFDKSASLTKAVTPMSLNNDLPPLPDRSTKPVKKVPSRTNLTAPPPPLPRSPTTAH